MQNLKIKAMAAAMAAITAVTPVLSTYTEVRVCKRHCKD